MSTDYTRFRPDNTQGYTTAQLAELNRLFTATVERMRIADELAAAPAALKASLDYVAARVQSEFDRLGRPMTAKSAGEESRPCTCGLAAAHGEPYVGSHLPGCRAVDWKLPAPTSARTFYEEGYANTVTRTLGILALPRTMAAEGEKVPYLKGVLASLRRTLEAAEQDLAAAEAAQDRAVSIREEYSDAEQGAVPTHPDGRAQQIEDRGSDSWCSRHGRIPWANDGICDACELEP